MVNEIPLQQAIDETAAWRAISEAKLGPNDIVNAFTVPLENFQQIIDHGGAVSVRAYLGENTNGEKTLLVVGVDANGDDMIDYNNGEYVYNETNPCPPACASGSPLA